ncbi:CHAD domain-containing protein [Tritonibacter scottomollicae]|uniref:CHAD domain-containing protein n=1 Tax=Tritonibacter scottomollicae TaxID=483013 RepID=UPI003BAD0E64
MTAEVSHSFLLDGAVEWPEIATALGDLRLEFDTEDTSLSFRMLDCHDQLLRKSGRVLLEFDDSLTMLTAGTPPQRQATAEAARFPADLPEGPVKRLTEKTFPLRCFLAMASGTLHRNSLRVVDDEGKTHLRGEILTVGSDAGHVTLVTLSPLRGYTRAPVRLGAALLAHGAGPLEAEHIFTTLAPNVPRYVAKPKMRFSGHETAFDVAVETIRNYIAVARANEAGVIGDLDTEFLHDYRVALRKVRSVLSLFKGVFGSVQTAELKAAFSDLMAPTGRVRDLDVYLMDRAAYDALVPEQLRPGLSVMFDAFAAERDGAQAKLVKHLKSKAYQKKISALEEQFAHPDGFVRGEAGGLSAEVYARKLVWKSYRKICKIAAHIGDDTVDEDVHELRIACKKFRYLLEFFAPLFPGKSAKRLIKRMKALQDTLGVFNDCSVQKDSLATFMSTHPAVTGARGLEAAQSIGALIAILDQRQRAERARVMTYFDQFNSAETRAEIKALCQRKGAAA